MKRLTGKIALITGAGQGIGHASALALAEDGATVVVADFNAQTGEAVTGEVIAAGGQATFIRFDATKEADVAALISSVVAQFGRLDCAFNNVGTGKTGVTVISETEADWDWTMAISLKSTFFSMKHEIPVMLAGGGGSIVNTSSMAAVIHAPTASPSYSAAKAGVIQLTKYAASAYAGQNIRVNSISPGLVATPLVVSMFESEQLNEIAAAGQLIHRPLRASEIADAVVYLCSDRSSMVTGINLEVCGGKK